MGGSLVPFPNPTSHPIDRYIDGYMTVSHALWTTCPLPSPQQLASSATCSSFTNGRPRAQGAAQKPASAPPCHAITTRSAWLAFQRRLQNVTVALVVHNIGGLQRQQRRALVRREVAGRALLGG